MWRSMDCLLPILVITMQRTSERVCHSCLSLNSHSTQAIEEGKDHPERSFVWTKRGRGGAPTEAACGDGRPLSKALYVFVPIYAVQ